jgi:hypothetical protein
MTAMPNLFLKWRLFRELFAMPRSDREIAIEYWGPNEGPSRFSKMLRGDYGVSADAAAMLAGVINRRIETWRGARSGLAAGGLVTASDIGLPSAEFVRRLIEAAGGTDADAAERAQRLAMELLAPQPAPSAQARLLVERYSKARVFAPFQPAGGAEAVRFDPRTDLGQLVVELPAAPAAPPQIYAMVTRDAITASKRFWELPFSESVWWLPSPFPAAAVEDNRIALMPEPQPVMALPGRYRATAVVVMDPAVLPRLDPRGGAGETLAPGQMDEQNTMRFLINLARVANRDSAALVCATAEYEILSPEDAAD